MKRGLRPEVLGVLPWLLAGLVWFGAIPAMRAEQADRLAQQGQVRRDRLKSDRAAREAQALGARIGAALGPACPASTDPAALRQRIVAATRGVGLSPVTLAVTGGPDGGAQVDAGGSKAAVLELARRLGDPRQGGFLRLLTMRAQDARWSVSAATGVLQSSSGGILSTRPKCSDTPDLDRRDVAAEAQSSGREKAAATRPARSPGKRQESVAAPAAEPTPAPPFTLVAFLMSEGKSRVSVRAGDQVRVIRVGDQIDEWTCISIDRDDGAVFTSPAHGRLVLITPR